MRNFTKNKRSYKHHISKTEKKWSHLRTVKAIVLNPLIKRGKKATVAGWLY